MSVSSSGQANAAWSACLAPNHLPIDVFLRSGLSNVPVALVPTNGESIRMKNPKSIQEELRKVTEHFQLITEVRQFGRGGILCCSPDQACVSDLLKCTTFASLPIYPMSRLPRGMCVIINNCNFEDVTERCDGSVHDVRPMEALFKTFLFDCIVHTDLKADEMKKLLSEAAKSKEHEQAQCLVVILISHGNQDTILGVDGETLNLENDVYREFNNEKCAALQGKPKLFFIQACQKNESDSGASTTVAETADTMAEPAEKPQSGKYDSEASTTMADSADDMADPAAKPQSAKRVSSWSDMYIAYAVISQYDAPRDTEIAACFLSVVFKVFSQCACVVHLDDLMKAVHEEVRGKSSHGGRSHTLGGGGRGWTKTLYFNPLKYV